MAKPNFGSSPTAGWCSIRTSMAHSESLGLRAPAPVSREPDRVATARLARTDFGPAMQYSLGSPRLEGSMSEEQREGVPLGVGTQLTYMPALDGIRAVSILGIMANHGGFAWAGGGVISVNVFFVLSGFLITSLLMKEWTRSGTIRLRAFGARGARRLLPALFVLLGGIGLYALLFAPGGTQSGIRGDGLSTLLYFSNWHQIFTGQSYFKQVSAPSPLLHTWTLAIEEQFYLVWPIVVVCVLKWTRSPRVLLMVAVLGVLASATEMALLFHPHLDPSRIYYGTDTRAQDILTGAALGILLFRQPTASS